MVGRHRQQQADKRRCAGHDACESHCRQAPVRAIRRRNVYLPRTSLLYAVWRAHVTDTLARISARYESCRAIIDPDACSTPWAKSCRISHLILPHRNLATPLLPAPCLSPVQSTFPSGSTRTCTCSSRPSVRERCPSRAVPPPAHPLAHRQPLPLLGRQFHGHDCRRTQLALRLPLQ